MSDVEGDAAPAPAPVPVMGGEAMDIHTAVQEVLKNAMVVDGLVRGLREAVKALDKRKAHLCILAANCDEPSYVKLVEALCVEHNIPMFKVDNNKKLGEWSGLCKIDREGTARKVVGCSCVVICDWGRETQALDVLNDYLKKKGRN